MKRAGLILAAALTALAQDGRLWLDVPFVQQEKNGCGAASIAMLMRHWRAHGAVSVPDADPAEIHRLLYSPEANGVYAREIEQYLSGAGFRVFVFQGEWDDLRTHLSKGRPLITCLREGRGRFHYTVVSG